MEKYVIEGGHTFKGSVIASGNKNEALPVIAACLLTDQPVVLKNVPRIGDTNTLLSILQDMGAIVTERDKNEIEVCCKNIHPRAIDAEKCASLRASLLLAGPLLARFGKVKLPRPGGDVIGRRRNDTHFSALAALGADIKVNHDFSLKADKLTGCSIYLDEQSVTATENVLMAAVMAKGTTVIKNAACEPHVTGLAQMLNSIGAKISGVGTHILKIEGVDNISGVTHIIGPDYIEIGSYIALAAITHSEIEIHGVNPDELDVIRLVYRKLGIEFEIEGNSVHIHSKQKLQVKADIDGHMPKIEDGTWPAFPSDLMSIAIVAATQTKGQVLFFEKMYDGRMVFTDSLTSMGAKIVQCDPHRIVVLGPTKLYSASLRSPDIRAGIALIIAALCAQKESIIYNIQQIDRGYENLEKKLQGLGANIRRVND